MGLYHVARQVIPATNLRRRLISDAGCDVDLDESSLSTQSNHYLIAPLYMAVHTAFYYIFYLPNPHHLFCEYVFESCSLAITLNSCQQRYIFSVNMFTCFYWRHHFIYLVVSYFSWIFWAFLSFVMTHVLPTQPAFDLDGWSFIILLSTLFTDSNRIIRCILTSPKPTRTLFSLRNYGTLRGLLYLTLLRNCFDCLRHKFSRIVPHQLSPLSLFILLFIPHR